MSLTDNVVSIQLGSGESITIQDDMAVKGIIVQSNIVEINGKVVFTDNSDNDLYFETVLKEGDELTETKDQGDAAMHIGGYLL